MLVLHSNEEGEVIDIINPKMVMVDVRGVKFPAYVDQLDFPYFKRFSEKKLFEPKKPRKYIDEVRKEKEAPKKKADGVWLSFLPRFESDEFGDDVVTELKVHLVNHTNKGYAFVYKLQFFGKPEFDLKAEVQPFEDFYLHDVPFADMNDSPVFTFRFSLAQADKTKADFFEAAVKLKPKQIFERIEKLKQKGEATFTQRLFEAYPEKAADAAIDFDVPVSNGVRMYNAAEARRHLPPARTAVDLHIEKLTDD